MRFGIIAAMSLTIAPLDRGRHIEAAASLLAERHARDRERDPRLPAGYEVPAACRPLIERTLDEIHVRGVVCLDGPDIVGFIVMQAQIIATTHMLASFLPPRGATIPFHGHAVAPGYEYDGYREMYGALAAYFVPLGFFEHGINVPARDAAARDAMSTVGFGLGSAAAVRDMAPVARAGADGIELHMASDEDRDVVFKLNHELYLHHARAPIFNPYPPESDLAGHEMQLGLLADPEANAHWVAYQDGVAVGMNTFMPPHFLSPMTVPDKTVYLFQGIVTEDARFGGVGSAILSRGVEWARERGYQHIALHFSTANLQGAKFWQSSGFSPVDYGMRRRIDERIAWANV